MNFQPLNAKGSFALTLLILPTTLKKNSVVFSSQPRGDGTSRQSFVREPLLVLIWQLKRLLEQHTVPSTV